MPGLLDLEGLNGPMSPQQIVAMNGPHPLISQWGKIANFMAPNFMSLMRGEPGPSASFTPNAVGKLPGQDDPRHLLAVLELASMIPVGPGEITAGATLVGKLLGTKLATAFGAPVARRAAVYATENALGRGAAAALPMDEASRIARARAMGYADEAFYRGEASEKLPNEYPSGAHFSRDPEYAQGFAQRGGKSEPREFRLTMGQAFKDYEPLSAQAYARLVSSAEPKLAAELVEMIAPGRTPEWFAEFARRNPEFNVTERGATPLVRQAIERGSADPIGLFQRAGFDALDSGRDVHKIAGEGIRLKEAAFDPAKLGSQNILAGLAAAGFAAPLLPPFFDPNLDRR
jgi:hypothetical protein